MTKRDQHTNDPALGHPDGDDDRGDAGADDADDHGGDADLSLLLMMYFSAAVNSPASFGSIVTRSSICTLFSLDAFVFALAC